MVGNYGIPMNDEIELERIKTRPSAPVDAV
jgi:hypothetical protein